MAIRRVTKARRVNSLATSARRLMPWRLTRAEISGGLADLGVLVPLEISLIALNGLNPTSTLLGVGIAYVLAGLYFRIPMPVQPLKAFAVTPSAQPAWLPPAGGLHPAGAG